MINTNLNEALQKLHLPNYTQAANSITTATRFPVASTESAFLALMHFLLGCV
ncbi:hypothetical protein EVA_07728 [gut metagenome]|uniref:Uncharacterized protein n=1 Tax=gut metagenome TaxID=749906 RepID=J9GA58_9ZZZZ